MKHPLVFAAMSVLLVAACGSSGGDSTSPTTNARTATLPSTTTAPDATSPTVTVSTPSGSRTVPAPDQPMTDEQWAASFGIPLERQPDLNGEPVWMDARNHRVVIPSCTVATSVIEPGRPYAGYAYLCRE